MRLSTQIRKVVLTFACIIVKTADFTIELQRIINNPKKQIMELASCGLCQLQVPYQNTVPAELPVHNAQNDSLKLSLKKLCKTCHSVISQIQQFATFHQIKYSDPQFKAQILENIKSVLPYPRPLIQQFFTSSAGFSQIQRNRSNSDSKSKLSKRFPQTQPSISQNEQQQPIHPYVALVIQEIKNKNLLCLSNLPKTLQLLIHVAEKQSIKGVLVSPQERREKLKNIVLFLAQRIHLSLEELPFVLVLANFLLCFMDPTKATAIIIHLSDILVVYPHLITWKTLILQQEKCISKNPLSPASVDMRAVVLKVQKLWLRIESILELSRRGQAVLTEGLVRLSKLQIVDYKQNRKKLAQILKPLLSKKEDKQEMTIERLNLMYLIKLQRNGYSLILKNMLQTEEEIKQELNQITSRFKKQKEEYIEKIVKLSNKIQELENKIEKLEEGNNSFISQIAALNELRESMIQQKLNEKYNRTSQFENQSAQILEATYPFNREFIALQDIVSLTNLIAFNEKHLGVNKKTPSFEKIEDMTKCIIQEIERLKQAYEKMLARAHHNEDEKNRLLGVVSRKDDRFISVITQKDVIIQRYEQALWRMENGLEVEEQPLAHRIRYIIHIFNKKRAPVIYEPEEEIVGKQKKQTKECQIY